MNFSDNDAVSRQTIVHFIMSQRHDFVLTLKVNDRGIRLKILIVVTV